MSLAKLVKELRERTGAGMMDCKKALEASNQDIDAAIDWLRENGIAKAAKKGDRVAAEGLTKVEIKGNKAIILELNSETDFVAKNEQFLDLLSTISGLLIDSEATTLEEGLAVTDSEGTSISELVTNGTASIGEKIDLRRFKIITKSDDQAFANYSHMGGRISVLALTNGDNAEVTKQVCMHIAAANPQYLSTDQISEETVAKERDILTKEALSEGKPENIVAKMVEGRLNKYFQEICLLEQDFVVDTDKKVKQVLADGNVELVEYARFEVGEGIEKEEVDFAAEVAAQAKM